MFWFIRREFSETDWPFFSGENATACFSAREAKNRYKKNREYLQEVTVTIPPMKEVTFKIPVRERGVEDYWFEEEILSNQKIDPKSRIVVNSLLKEYMFCKWWYFVKKETWDKMHTKNMEALQLMKDVMLWFVRYEPIDLEYQVWKWAKRKTINYSWEIAEDIPITYMVGDKKYKTTVYWVYTQKIRKCMFNRIDEHGRPYNMFEFYWGHELQYRQRQAELEYWSVNYICASREVWKTLFGEYMLIKHLYKCPTQKKHIADPWYLDSHFIVPVNSLIKDYTKKMKEFFSNMFVNHYRLTKEAANQIVEWKNSEFTFTFKTAKYDRTIEVISEQSTNRKGIRSTFWLLDECNTLKKYEEMSEVIGNSGAQWIMNISTISKDSKKSEFYNLWTKAVVETKKLKPIDEIIHMLWIKYGFDEMKSRDDYIRMMDEWVFEQVQAEYFTLRPLYWMKVTVDDWEHLTKEEKVVKINRAINLAWWYDWMLAELYCELAPDKPAINYRPNIIEQSEIPKIFDKIYAWYDEADSFDGATLCIIWLLDKKLYVLEAEELPRPLEEKMQRINQMIMPYVQKSRHKPSMIMDVQRGSAWYRETARAVPFLDMGIKARWENVEKFASQDWVWFYLVWNPVLVIDVMNTELINQDKIFFSDSLGGSTWLFSQIDNFIRYDSGRFKWKGKAKDDLVSALLYWAYYAFKDWFTKDFSWQFEFSEDKIENMDIQFDREVREAKVKKRSKALWSRR